MFMRGCLVDFALLLYFAGRDHDWGDEIGNSFHYQYGWDTNWAVHS